MRWWWAVLVAGLVGWGVAKGTEPAPDVNVPTATTAAYEQHELPTTTIRDCPTRYTVRMGGGPCVSRP